VVWDDAKAAAARTQSDLEELAFLFNASSANPDRVQEQLPTWTEMNKSFRSSQIPALAAAHTDSSGTSIVLTATPIADDPTNVNTLWEFVRRCNEHRKLREELEMEEQKVVLVTVDGGEWHRLDQLIEGTEHEKTIFPWLGGFHIILMMMGAIFTMTDEHGLAEAVVAAGGVGSLNAANHALKGKHYKRGMRLQKTLYEVLGCRQIEAFVLSIRTGTDQTLKDKLAGHHHVLAAVRDGGDACEAAIASDRAVQFLQSLNTWIAGQVAKDGTIKFNQMIIDAIRCELRFVRWSRDPKRFGLPGYIEPIEAFAWAQTTTNRLLHDRMVAVMLKKLRTVRVTHGDEFADHILDGEALAIQQTGMVFSSIWPDLHLECNANCCAKMYCKFLVQHQNKYMSIVELVSERTRCSKAMHELARGCAIIKLRRRRTPGTGLAWKPRSKADTDFAMKLRVFIDDVDVPAVAGEDADPERLVHFTSKVLARPEVAACLLDLVDLGVARSMDIIRSRLERDENHEEFKSIWAPLKKSKLLTWKQNGNAGKLSGKFKTCLQQRLEHTTKLMVLNAEMETPIKMWDPADPDCLARFEFASAPHALFEGGAPRKAAEAGFMHELLGTRPPAMPPALDPVGEACIVDFASYIHRATAAVKDSELTVDLPSHAIKMALATAQQQSCCVLHLCADVYDAESGTPKDAEALHRLKGKMINEHAEVRGRDSNKPTKMLRPHAMRDFLGSGINKTRLLAHIKSEAVKELGSNRHKGMTAVCLLNTAGIASATVTKPGPGPEGW